MSESCGRFDQWLREAQADTPDPEQSAHFDECAECREQWLTHRLLVATVAEQPVPDLSGEFESTIRRTLAAEVEVRPLRGWRRLALLGYAAAAIAAIAWAFGRVTLPPIDVGSPWLAAAAFLAVPLSFALAIAVSRWMPASRFQP